jgi:arylformamidase
MEHRIDPALEREYNNRAKVPDFAAIARGWAEAAAAFRAGHANSEFGLAYGPSPRQAMDIFWPGTGRDAPLAVFIHGGYWQATDRSFYSHLAAGLNGHGVAVAMPSYDLCPDVPLGEIVTQARRAVAFLHTRYGRPVLASGHSAGGHLAACLLATDWEAAGLPAAMVPAAISFSGLFDLEPLVQTSLNAALRLDGDMARRLSPVLWPRPAGHIHAAVGGTEGNEYLRQSRSIAEAWGGSWNVAAGENHFSLLDHLADARSALTLRVVQLVRAYFP